jgi:hypothetical protein
MKEKSYMTTNLRGQTSFFCAKSCWESTKLFTGANVIKCFFCITDKGQIS